MTSGICMLYMAWFGFSVPYKTISLNDWCSSKFVEFNVVFVVSMLLNIHSKSWKEVFVHPDCSEHSAITERSWLEFYGQNHSIHNTYIIMCTAFCMCNKGLNFFLVKLIGKTTNCHLNGIFNYYPDFSISSSHSNCPVRDNIPYVTENFHYLAENLMPCCCIPRHISIFNQSN